jgi:hypothetical protein
MIKSLLFREWAILFFPINWSLPSLAVACGTVLMIGGAAIFLVASRPARRCVVGAAILVIAAALPAQHLLLIGRELTGARVLYLPIAFTGLFWGVVAQGCPRPRMACIAACGLVAFQLVALEHQLRIWREVAFRAQGICRDFGQRVARDRRPVFVRNLPATFEGVFFLNDGFPECVAYNSREPLSDVHVDSREAIPPAGARIFAWNPGTGQIDEVRE